MTQAVTQADLLDRLRQLSSGSARHLVALAGPPGAGKSYIAETLQAALPDCSAVLPMDGFHLDDGLLAARGELARKGAPHSFDLDGFTAMLDRLRADDGRAVLVPVFDRQLEISRAAAREIAPHVRLVLVEGNYLLLDRPGWAQLAPRFAPTVMVTAPRHVLQDRLAARWRHLSPAAAQAKLAGNDIPNMDLVQRHSLAPDLILQNG